MSEKRGLLDMGIREIIALSRMCNETREGLRVLVERVAALEAMEGALVERVARLERVGEPIGRLLDDQIKVLIPELRERVEKLEYEKRYEGRKWEE